MMKKRRLGKGLDSLLSPPDAEAGSDSGVREIALARIELNPYQPRADVDEEGIEELAGSIRSAGILQPVAVRPAAGGMYELIMGERRLRAARRAGLAAVPAIVREVDEDRMLELALIENVQRRDLNGMEKAKALQKMCSDLELTQQEVAERIGLGRPTVANLLRLLDLPEEVQEMVSRGTLSSGHARAVLAAPTAAARLALARRVREEGLSVRETERLAARATEGTSSSPGPPAPSPHVQRLQTVLSEALHADVDIKTRGKKGRIVIHFTDHEEFERLFARFTGEHEMPV